MRRKTHDLSREPFSALRSHLRDEIREVPSRSEETRDIRDDEVVREVPNVLGEIGDGTVLVGHVGADKPAPSTVEKTRESAELEVRSSTR